MTKRDIPSGVRFMIGLLYNKNFKFLLSWLCDSPKDVCGRRNLIEFVVQPAACFALPYPRDEAISDLLRIFHIPFQLILKRLILFGGPDDE